MTDLERAIICFLNKYHKEYIYRYEQYQMFHGLKYKKELEEHNLEMIRSKYKGNCLEASYELKTYYTENNLLSNTIVLKMRPESPEIQELRNIKIHSEIDGVDYEYTHHAIEVFKENGKYKVLDILHRNKIVWLENFLDEICETNHCPREQLRYDMGYLAPAHVFAGNMKELSDLMRYLDKQYNIGKPRLNLINEPKIGDDAFLLSDDLIMDFDEFGRAFGVSGMVVIRAFQKVYDKLMGIRFNTLHILCLGHIMRDPIVSLAMIGGLFDDEEICQMMDRKII